MGMYSSFADEDIKVKDMKGLKAFMERWKKAIPEHWIHMDEPARSVKMFKLDNTGKEYFTFEDWNDIKLISYWYDTDVAFLHCVAKYIEGYVYWSFENDDESGNVEFTNGECIIHTGVMQYTKRKASEMINYIDGKEPKGLDKLREIMTLESI